MNWIQSSSEYSPPSRLECNINGSNEVFGNMRFQKTKAQLQTPCSLPSTLRANSRSASSQSWNCLTSSCELCFSSTMEQKTQKFYRFLQRNKKRRRSVSFFRFHITRSAVHNESAAMTCACRHDVEFKISQLFVRNPRHMCYVTVALTAMTFSS